MILHHVVLPYKECVRIRMISDTHIGAKNAEEKRLKRDIETVLKENEAGITTRVILGGDQIEAIVRQDLRRFGMKQVREDLYDEVDSLLNAQLRLGIQTFKPLAEKGLIIGALVGNHELKIKKDFSFDLHSELCERLHIKNLGYSCMIRANITRRNGMGKNVFIYCHHGHGGNGRKPGASINRMEDLSMDFDFDIAFMGHNHKRHAHKGTRLSMTIHGAPKLIEKDIAYIRSGGYYKTYEEGEDPSYGEKEGYSPLKIGSPPYAEIKYKGHDELIDIGVYQ